MKSGALLLFFFLQLYFFFFWVLFLIVIRLDSLCALFKRRSLRISTHIFVLFHQSLTLLFIQKVSKRPRQWLQITMTQYTLLSQQKCHSTLLNTYIFPSWMNFIFEFVNIGGVFHADLLYGSQSICRPERSSHSPARTPPLVHPSDQSTDRPTTINVRALSSIPIHIFVYI